MPAKNKRAGKQTNASKEDTFRKKIVFSFEYYHPTDIEWCISGLSEAGEVRAALDSLRAVSQKSLEELGRESKGWNFHQINWNDTTRPKGFDNSLIDELPSFQFSLPHVPGGKCRVEGAYYEGVFYIVWFDIHHRLYKSTLKHT